LNVTKAVGVVYVSGIDQAFNWCYVVYSDIV